MKNNKVFSYTWQDSIYVGKGFDEWYVECFISEHDKRVSVINDENNEGCSYTFDE